MRLTIFVVFVYLGDWQDVLLIDQNILIYQTVADISVCVVFGQEQNEILMSTLLNTFMEALHAIIPYTQSDAYTFVYNV